MTAMTVHILDVGNDNTIFFKLCSPPTDPEDAEDSGDAITNASPSMTIKSASDVEISGGGFPVTLSHIGSGWYSGVAPSATAIAHGVAYKVVVEVGTTTLVEAIAVAWDRTLVDPTQRAASKIAVAAGLPA